MRAITETLNRMGKKRKITDKLGPGLITGASDTDPSNIATYSQIGAQFGYQMLWTAWFLYPLMAAIQEISSRIGRVTGQGLGTNIGRYYPRWLLYGIMALLLFANTINLGADLGAMGSALQLLIGGPAIGYSIFFGLLCVLLEVFIKYDRFAHILKWLTLVLFSYVGTAFAAQVDWPQALKNFLLPTLQLKADYMMGLVAVFGTSISPYLFFWQASQEVEIERETPGKKALKAAPQQAPDELKRIQIDTYAGMALSQFISFFIVVTAAATLPNLGIKEVPTAAQTAEALRPLAGDFAFFLFSIGIIGTGLLSVPALAGSAAYAVAETMRWPEGLSRNPRQAKGFYGVVALTTLIGAAINFFDINPIKALYVSAVINGLVAVPIMVLMMLLASRTKTMGKFVVSPGLKVLGWFATAVMAVAGGGLIVNLFI